MKPPSAFLINTALGSTQKDGLFLGHKLSSPIVNKQVEMSSSFFFLFD